MKKIVILLLSAALIISLFACGKDGGDTTGTESDTGVYVPADVSDVPSPMKINGREIPYGLFRYYYAAVKYQYDLDDPDFWLDSGKYDEVRDLTVFYMKRIAAVQEYAEQNGVELTEIEKKQAQQSVNESRYSSFEDDNDYYRALDLYFLTEETNLLLEEQQMLEEKLFEYLISGESGPKISSNPELIRRFVNNHVVRVDHILVRNDEGEDRNENETLIKELYERLQNGADFYELKHKYTEDTDNADDDTGYYISKGDKSQQFSDASFALEVGQMSGVVEAPYGYHIILRLEPDEEFIGNNLDGQFLELYRYGMFNTALYKLMDAQTVEYDPSFYTYTPLNIK